jgi:hypothetical protein
LASKKRPSALTAVRDLMEDYAKRGVFRGFASQPVRHGVAAFRMIWHHDRVFDLIVDTHKKTILIPVVLPAVPSRSPLYEDFRAFVESHHAPTLPDHRRIEKSKVRVRCANRRGSASLTMALRDEDYAYALQRLVHLVHETFLIFLADGPYRDYMAEQLGANVEIG